MNVILEGPEAVGKTTLAEKLRDKFNMTIVHSTSSTRNDLGYHLDLLDYRKNTVFDRFHVGETVYPIVYKRDPKIKDDEFKIIEKRIMDNNDIFIIFYTSDLSIVNERLIERGEDKFIPLMELQNSLFKDYAEKFQKTYTYKNFYVIDIAKPTAYDELDAWIDEHYGKTTPNIVYRQLANDLLDKSHPMDSANPRGATKEICNYMFTIDDITGNECVTLKSGGTNLTYVAAELLWYWSARNDLEYITKFSKFWEKVSDDHKTANSAYGYILQKKHGFNQIEKMIELLKKDPTSRRAVMNINVPNEKVIETKDEMCTICLNYQIRDGKLHSTCVMRSNDYNFGLRNDLPFFLYLQKYIADRLFVGYGSYTHIAFSMHMYNKDFEFTKKVAYNSLESSNQRLDISRLINNKDQIIKWIDSHELKEDDEKKEFEQLLKKKKIIYEV